MKYLKKIFVGIFICLTFIPCFVKAEEKVNVYIFWGDGCPHCAKAKEFFNGLDEETKNKFNLIDYEVWSNQENSSLMEKAGSALGTEVKGVPFIVIGENYLSGYAESENEKILNYINDEYNKDDRYDIMKNLDTKKTTKTEKGSSIVSLIVVIALILVVGTIYGISIITKEKKSK